MTILGRRNYALWVAGLLAAAGALAEVGPLAIADTGTSASQSRYASCIVTVTPGTSASPLDVDTIDAIIDSVGVQGKALSEVLGMVTSPDDGLVSISFDALPESELDEEVREVMGAPISGRLIVEYLDEETNYRAGADDLLKAITVRLAKVIEEQGAAQLESLAQRRGLAEADVERTKSRLAELQEAANALRAEAGRTDLSRDTIIEEVHELEAELRESEMEAASHDAKREAIAAQIAKIGETVKARPSANEVTQALHQVVELREMYAQRTRALFESGQTSQAELKQAEVEHAMARAELARHLEEQADAAGGGAMSGLNEQLMQLSIDAVEVQARQKALQARLEQIRATKLLDLADRYEREVRVQREVGEEMLEEALRRHEAADRVLRSYQPPSVVVVGGM
jgi:hypothetical protein